MKIHSNAYNVFMGLILKASQIIFPLVTFPYVSRVLLPEGNGRISFASSVVNIFSTIAMLGIPVYGIRACAKIRDDRIKLAKTVKELLIINTFSVVVSYSALIALITFSNAFSENKYLIIAFSFSILLTAFGVEWFYQAVEQYDYITIRSLIGKILSIILMLVFVKTSDDILVYAIITVIGTVGTNILNIIRLPRLVCFKDVGLLELRQHIKPIIVLFAFSAVTAIYTSMDSVMLGFISGMTENGYYGAAVKIKNLLVSVITVASSVLLPRSAYLLESKHESEYIRLIRMTANFTLIISIPMVLFCLYESKTIILILAGTTFLPAAEALRYILPSVVVIGITQILGMQYYIASNKDRIVLFSCIVGSIINVFFNSVFIPRLGASGAAIATTVAEVSVLVIQVMFMKDNIKSFFDMKEILKVCISAFSCLLILSMLPEKMHSSLYGIVICAVVYFCSTVFLLFLLTPSRSWDLLKRLRPKQ